MQLIKKFSDWRIDRALHVHELTTGEELCEAIEIQRKKLFEDMKRIDNLCYQLSSPGVENPQAIAREINKQADELARSFKKNSRLLLEFAERLNENAGEQNA